MKNLTLAAALMGATLLPASGALAATFTIDPGSVTVSGVDLCVLGNCELKGVVQGGSFDLDSIGQTATLDKLFDWDIDTTRWATGGGVYKVTAQLNFSAPTAATTSGSGYAGFIVLGGALSAGALTWTDGSGSVSFGTDSYALDYKLFNVLKGGFGTSTTSGASFTLTDMPAPAPVPLPASALLLAGGVAAFGALRRRKAAKA